VRLPVDRVAVADVEQARVVRLGLGHPEGTGGTGTVPPVVSASSHAITVASVPAASAGVQKTCERSPERAASRKRATLRASGWWLARASIERPRETPLSLKSGSSSSRSDDSLPSTSRE